MVAMSSEAVIAQRTYTDPLFEVWITTCLGSTTVGRFNISNNRNLPVGPSIGKKAALLDRRLGILKRSQNMIGNPSLPIWTTTSDRKATWPRPPKFF